MIMDYIFIFTILFVIVGGLVWWNTHCPKCYRPFAKQLLKKDKRTLGQFVQGKQKRHYECRKCGHEWSKVVYIDQ